MSEQKFKTTITSKHKLFDLHLKETFKYRDLIWLFVKRDFVAKYKQTLLGPLWAIIQPLLTTIVFTIIFGSLAKLTTADIPNVFAVPGFLFYMSGTIIWGYFVSNTLSISGTFLNNKGTMGKVYYPRFAQPIATSLSNLVSFAIQFVLFLVIWLVYICIGNPNVADIHVTWWILLLPLIILEMIVLSMGLGMAISAVTTKYRDLQMLVGFGLELWKYASPVAYGLALVSKSNFFQLYLCNPMTTVITSFRYSMFGNGFFDYRFYIIGWAISLFLFFFGLVLFSKTEKNFMDTI